MVSFDVDDGTYLEPGTVSAHSDCCVLTGLWFCMYKEAATWRGF